MRGIPKPATASSAGSRARRQGRRAEFDRIKVIYDEGIQAGEREARSAQKEGRRRGEGH